MNKNQKTKELNCRKHIANVVGADDSVCPKKQSGITLIALVITIIVMLILVGVTVSIAINGGLFGMAKKAKTQTEKARDVEQELANGRILVGDTWYDSMSDYVNGNRSKDQSEGGTYFTADKNEDGTLKENATYESGGYTATIPKGFKVSEVAGEDKIATGLVIKDADGNEFVWIPVDTSSDYKRRVFLSNQPADEEYPDRIRHWTGDSIYFTEDMPEDELLSVKEYKGFYIARYEAGIEGYTSINSNGDKTGDWTGYSGENMKLVIQPQKQVWNYITIDRAKTESENLYNKEKDDIQSKLCSSYAWDTALSFIAKSYPDYLNNSTQGNYRSIEFDYIDLEGVSQTKKKDAVVVVPTGETKAVNNIFDMGGNVWEYTTENSSDEKKPLVGRGGCCNNNLDAWSTSSFRWQTKTEDAGYHIGFRITLFL